MLYFAGVVKWQTRSVQNAMSASSWEFKSPLQHGKILIRGAKISKAGATKIKN